MLRTTLINGWDSVFTENDVPRKNEFWHVTIYQNWKAECIWQSWISMDNGDRYFRIYNNAESTWGAFIAKTNLKYHAREIIRSGTITDFIVDKISSGYYGGDIVTVSYFIPSDTFKGYGWGLIHWKKSESNIAFLTYYPDRSTEIGYKSISPSENYDTGWVTK